MTDPDFEPKDTFPDVRVSAQVALVAMFGLSLLYGLIYAALAGAHQITLIERMASLAFASVLLVLSYIDLRTGFLPDLLTLPLIAAGLAFSYFVTGTWIWSLAGAFVGYGLVAGLALIWRHGRGYEGIGLGDAKLLAGLGAWVGLLYLPAVLLVASTSGLLTMLAVSQLPRSDREAAAIAFGPFLAFAGWLTWCGAHSFAL